LVGAPRNGHQSAAARPE